MNPRETPIAINRGLLQGSIISPLLANIYLHELDVFIQNKIIPKYTVGDKKIADKTNYYIRSQVLKSEIKEN